MEKKSAILPFFVPHLGCPNACVFCNQHSITGQKTAITGETVLREAREYLSQLQKTTQPQLAYYGGSFTAIERSLQRELLDAAQILFEGGLISGIRISTRPDAISWEILNFLLQYPVAVIELGAQSMSDEVLLQSKRGHRAQDTKRAARLIKKRGISCILQMMAGLPGDSKTETLHTARRLAALKPDGVRIYPAAVLRHTELFSLWQAGLYEPLTLEQAVDVTADCLALFVKRSIPVIRMGLNPSDELAAEVAAGVYHESFGELVYTRCYKRAAEALLRKEKDTADVTLYVPKRHTSKVVGHRGSGKIALQETFSIKRLRILEDASLKPLTLRIGRPARKDSLLKKIWNYTHTTSKVKHF